MMSTQLVKIDEHSQQEMRRQKQGKIQRSRLQLGLTELVGYCRASEVKNQSLTISTLPFTTNKISNQYFKLETLLLKKRIQIQNIQILSRDLNYNENIDKWEISPSYHAQISKFLLGNHPNNGATQLTSTATILRKVQKYLMVCKIFLHKTLLH